jgi:hypothetical protein
VEITEDPPEEAGASFPPGRLYGIRCLIRRGKEGIVVSPSVEPDAVEAVQDAVTWVTANLPLLRQWLGNGPRLPSEQRCGRRSDLLWRPEKDAVFVSFGEVRRSIRGRYACMQPSTNGCARTLYYMCSQVRLNLPEC